MDETFYIVALPKRRFCYIKNQNEKGKKIGYRVIVEFENDKTCGIIIGETKKTKEWEIAKKYEIPDEFPLIPQNMIELSKKIAEKYFCDLFDILKIISPPQYLELEVKTKKEKKRKNKEKYNEEEKKSEEEREKSNEEGKKSDEKSSEEGKESKLNYQEEDGTENLISKVLKEPEKKFLDLLEKKRKITLKRAKKLLKIKRILELENLGLIKITFTKKQKSKEEVEKSLKKIREKKEKEQENQAYHQKKERVKLSEEQQKALDEILNNEGMFLLHGVTGSGKTEIYLRAIEKEIQDGGAIYLLPEISLTTFLIKRIKEYFPDAVVLHSALTQKEREINWWSIRYGIAKVAVGARSAIFAPFEKTKIIVVDEEHDPSYKQSPESSNLPVFYDARFVAELRSKIEGSKIVFGSATPSTNTYMRAKKREIKLIKLTKRVPGMEFPKTQIIDLKKSGYDEFFSFPISPELREEIEKRIIRKENVILLFTRRGWALYIICTACSTRLTCKNCSASLVYHKNEGMVCHWCGKTYPLPEKCEKCGSEELEIVGFGTERIEEEIKNVFKVPVFRMDSDNVKSEKKAMEILQKFEKTSPAILVGTQMVAKGFDFPSVTLVGVILADTEFMLPDFKADERAFTILNQVCGRAGRKIKNENSISHETENISIIQTFMPEHNIIKYAVSQNYEKFFEEEIQKREEFELPPFSEIACIRFSGKDEKKCYMISEMISSKIKEKGIKCDPPTKSMRYLVSGKFNLKMLVYLRDENDIKKLKEVIKKSQFFLHGVKITLDINPENVL
jgi:primosomal protein N' (replication factor Y)